MPIMSKSILTCNLIIKLAYSQCGSITRVVQLLEFEDRDYKLYKKFSSNMLNQLSKCQYTKCCCNHLYDINSSSLSLKNY